MEKSEMKSVTLLGALLALQTLPRPAAAAPATYGSAKCGGLTIENDTGATLVRDHEDCRLVWVLPPTAGSAQFSGYDGHANLNLCQELKETQKSSLRVTKQIDDTNAEITKLLPSRQAADQAVAKAKARVRDLLQKAELLQLQTIQERLKDIDVRMEDIVKNSLACGDDCETLRAEHKNLAEERTRLGREQRDLRKQFLAEVKDFDRAKAIENAAVEKRDAVIASVDAIMSQQIKYKNTLHQMMKTYSTYGAGIAYVNYDTGWDAAVATLSQRYAGQFEFRKVQTKDARVFANVVSQGDQETYLSSLPAVLGYSLNGLKYQPFGEEVNPGMNALPSVLGGSISLSLIGGCPLYYKNFIDSNGLEPAGTERNNYAFAISATYNYPSVYKMKMEAKYNLYKFYEKIVESSSSGGFFSSRTNTSVVENSVNRDGFVIDWTVQDPSSIYNEAKRQEVASELKQQLIGRVLNMTASPQLQAPDMSVPAPVMGEHGAVVFANGLEKTCGGINVWCTAGVWVLRGLDSIFGSSSATNSYRKAMDNWATDTWSSETVQWNAGAMVFVPRK